MRGEQALETVRTTDRPDRGKSLDPVRVREAADGEGRVGQLKERREPGAGYVSRYLRESGTLVAGGTVASSPST